MGIQSASATFVRFHVPDVVSGDFWGYIDENLRAGSFTDLEDGQEQVDGICVLG